MKLSCPEYNTVLAALRLWQLHLEGRVILPEDVAFDLNNVAADDTTHAPLSVDEVEELCADINS